MAIGCNKTCEPRKSVSESLQLSFHLDYSSTGTGMTLVNGLNRPAIESKGKMTQFLNRAIAASTSDFCAAVSGGNGERGGPP